MSPKGVPDIDESLRAIEGVIEKRLEAENISRKFILKCKKIINSARDMNDLDELEVIAKESLKHLLGWLSRAKEEVSDVFWCPIYQTMSGSLQECLEALIYVKILKNSEIPKPEQLGVSIRDYLLSLADVVGELRRSFLHLSKKGASKEDLSRIIEAMEGIYELLESVTVPDSLVPLRRKVDTIRISLDRTLSEYHFMLTCSREVKGDEEDE